MYYCIQVIYNTNVDINSEGHLLLKGPKRSGGEQVASQVSFWQQ